MVKFEYQITDPVGIHARPAGKLVKKCSEFQSTVWIEDTNGKKAEGKKLMALMGLGIRQGQSVTVSAEGEDEEQAIRELETFFHEEL